MNRLIILLIFFSISSNCFTQEKENKEKESIKYYGRDYYLLEGTSFPDSVKENPFHRFPADMKDKVREPVWNLSKSSAGLSVRFLSNTKNISVRWEVKGDVKMNHFAETGIKGVDLYFNNNGTWQYLNTGRPTGFENESSIIKNMDSAMREYRIYLPLYDELLKLEVGVDSLSQFIKPEKLNKQPIVFYGTSITQGGCASRTGMAHTNIISRKLGVECINFGFSGNGKMEEPIVDLIAGIDASIYVLECLPNMKPEEVTERTIPTVETIREKHPETPIILVENFIYTSYALSNTTIESIDKKNEALKIEFDKLVNNGVKNIFFVKTQNALGSDNEGTVDSVHFTDLGFERYADFLIGKFKEFKILQ